ncbi:MAG: hypothetical protein FWC40_03050 [Proteobacteria bacterium]|nr:hypothetical protein [Pseudomonadota bacterium]
MSESTRDVDERELDDDLNDDLMNSYSGEDSLENELEEAELIEEWCPECREIRPHAVMHDGTRRVVCAECHHEHRRETGSKSAAPAARGLLSAEEMADEASREAAWARLTRDVAEAEIKAYSIRGQFRQGDVVRHPTFGLGAVLELIESTKAEILFEDRVRRLVCGKR